MTTTTTIAPQLTALSVPIDSVTPHPRNINQGDTGAISVSLEAFSQYAPIVVQRSTGHIVKGNHTYLAARALGWTEIAANVMDLDDTQALAVLVGDNRHSELATRDQDALAVLLTELAEADALLGTGYDGDDLDQLIADLAGPTVGQTDPDAVPSVPDVPITQPGDLWVLGRHRLLCGDATVPADVARLLDGVVPDCLVTDPPYCSGGFQEAGRSAGSIGTDAKIKPSIANDRLSTRGYMALIKAVLTLAQCPMTYVFTDWRMWVNLFDVVESSGYGVRSMVVWDKGSPGMGMGWRSQHELIMFAVKAVVKFDGHKAQGNVIPWSRTGNPLHPTQKPIELLQKLLDVADMARTLYDPFAGSGSTLLAAEQMGGRDVFMMELDAAFCDVIVRRWEEFTSGRAVRGE